MSTKIGRLIDQSYRPESYPDIEICQWADENFAWTDLRRPGTHVAAVAVFIKAGRVCIDVLDEDSLLVARLVVSRDKCRKSSPPEEPCPPTP